MKKITQFVLLFLILLFNQTSFGQNEESYQNAQKYLNSKGEVIIRFKANNQAQFLEFNQFLSVSHEKVDQQTLEVAAYANKDQFKRFLTYGLNYSVTVEDNEIPQNLTARYSSNKRTTATWDSSWDAYPKYSEYVAKMQYWASTYPNLCTLQEIGTTPLGRKLYVLKISDNASADETEPEFFYTSSMHGDEITGYPTMLRLIDYLLTNYGSNTEVTNLVNGTEIFINPLANPDGSYKKIGNDTYNSSGNTPTRANSNGVDLNRNYADAIGGLHADGLAYQPETIAFMNFQATRNFVLAANYHGGTEVVNFPFDTSNTPGTGAFNYHPHDNYFKYIAKEYAQLCQTADGNLNYMDAVYNSGQFPGTTNGAAWYSVYGGRQDASNFFEHSKEVTVEISDVKTPAASALPFYWDRNKQALLNYVKQAGYGLNGVVTNQSGNPIHAKVYIGGTFDNFGSWVETSATNGDYHKVQIGGTYDVIFEAPGYVTQTITKTITNGATTTLNVTMVPTTAIPTANDATICTGQTAPLSATGTGNIRWYDSATSTSPLATAASYTAPALTSNTSYWVEREVTLANIGPATVSGTASTNANVKNRYLIFSATAPTKLKSVSITASAVGQLLVELQNSAGVMLESKVVRLTTSGNQDIDLDFFIPIGTNLRLVSREISGLNLTAATSGITYPYTSGPISITANSGTGTFFQFFNWKLEPQKSNRDEVVVTVKPNPTNTSISPTAKVAGSSSFTLTVNGANFVNGESIVRWNGTNKTTTFVSATQLTAIVTAAEITTAGTVNVSVYNTCNATNSDNQTFTITCTAPVANVASLPTVTGQCSATVIAPKATSTCYGQITGTTTTTFPITTQGTTVVTWTYNDGNGNSITQDQNVTVIDKIIPTVLTKDIAITLSGGASVTITADDIDNGSTDNCSIATKTLSQDTFTSADTGIKTVTLTITDVNGNQNTATAQVTVQNSLNTTILKNSQLVVYPIPFDNTLTINVPETYSDNVLYIQLIDMSGKLIYNKKQVINTKSIQLNDVKQLQDGNYIISILDKNQKVIKRLLIIKKASL